MRALLLAAIVAAPMTASATCYPFQSFVDGLRAQYHETPIFIGEGTAQPGLVVTANQDRSGSWTIFAVVGKGKAAMACPVASGDGYATAPLPPNA